MNNFNLPPGVSVMDKHINPSETIDIDDTVCQTWFERDRSHVCLVDKETEQTTYIEYWDADVYELIEAGFLNASDWHQSLYDYAVYLGVL